MNKTQKQLFAFSIILILSTLACTSVYGFFGTSRNYCEAIGGRWIPEIAPPESFADELDGECVKPYSDISAIENATSAPAGEISIEACLAQPDEYTWEFANLKDELRNDTKEVCGGGFHSVQHQQQGAGF